VSRLRRIRDPVHGFVEIRSQEGDLLDTPVIQRLRRIQQLAMAYLVYPGAVHTRFDHTLGVLHVASKLCNVLRLDVDPTRIIRLAALLHDVGHGPFSHVSEAVLDELASGKLSRAAGKKEKIHEAITQKIILEHKDLRTLGEKDRQEISALLREGIDQRVYRDIVSGPLDADKQDYLLRDSYFCGVKYGVYDIDQLHNTLRQGPDGDDQALMVEPGGVHALEQFVLAKYYLTTQIYRHKVRLITDNMLIRAIRLGVQEDKIAFLRKLYLYEETPRYLANYVKWDDRRLLTEILRPVHAETLAGDLFRRLVDRRLFKQVFAINMRELPAPIPERMKEDFSKVRGQLEADIAEELSRVLGQRGVKVSRHFVVLHPFSVESVRAQSRNSEGSIMILKGQRPIPLEQESTLFRSIDESLKEEHLECYAPVGYQDDKQKRDIQEKMRDFILALLRRNFVTRPQKDKDRRR
jgi:uncharacterized protein